MSYVLAYLAGCLTPYAWSNRAAIKEWVSSHFKKKA